MGLLRASSASARWPLGWSAPCALRPMRELVSRRCELGTLTVSAKLAWCALPGARVLRTGSRGERASSSAVRALASPPVASARASASSESEEVVFELSPSDFAFLWDGCRRCFYLKAHKLLPRPRTPFPSIFNEIDVQMKMYFRNASTTDIIPEMRPGYFVCEEKDLWVQSQPLRVPGRDAKIVLRGMVDSLVQFTDDESYGIIDFKTSNVDKSLAMYSRQLHAYAFCVENPGPASEVPLLNISDLALVVYEPKRFSAVRWNQEGTFKQQIGGRLDGELAYVPIERDDAAFLEFLAEVVAVLEEPVPPAPAPPNRWSKGGSGCAFCQYLIDAKRAGQTAEE
mmetsp:Transcript_5485/g.14730  ORF Transcript_5485/g.14730 Transcript_5485/m.14730 type:complete len:341 (-) Transcript_5485:10-1032(-)